jgi:hypothetical protein
MNSPLPAALTGQFRTVLDIGSIEHVFDTRQCLANLFALVPLGGSLMIHTPVHGFFDHGFHTFSPDCLIQAFELNGFEITYLKYSATGGVELADPSLLNDTLIWIAGRRREAPGEFVVPQQGRWSSVYYRNQSQKRGGAADSPRAGTGPAGLRTPG